MRPALVDWAALGAGAGLLLWCRWPGLWAPWPLNPDEAQMLAQAMTLRVHPVPWHSYDPTTSGPLNSALLAVPLLGGTPPSYAAGRLAALGLELGAVVCLFLGLRRLFGSTVAWAGSVLPFAFFCVVAAPEWVNYTSEHLALFLVAFIGYELAALAAERGTRAWGHAGAAGLLAGALPFAKLQAAPMLLWALGTAVAIAVVRRGETAEPGGFRRKALVALAAGLAVVPLLILVPVALSGSLGDFVTCYLAVPFVYVGYAAAATGGALGAAGYFATPEFARYLLCLAGIGLASCAGAAVAAAGPRRFPSRRALGFTASAAVLAFASIVAIEAPQSPFQHYLLFLVLPAAALAAGLLAALSTALEGGSSGGDRSRRARILSALPAGCAALAFVLPRVAAPDPYAASAWQAPPERAARVEIEGMLAQHIRPGDRVAIWGWMPEYLVSSGALAGTRDSITEFQMGEHPYAAYYRARYLGDLAANRPRFFLDAVAPSSFAFTDRASAGFETFPALAEQVRRDYALAGERDGVRLYRRMGS